MGADACHSRQILTLATLNRFSPAYWLTDMSVNMHLNRWCQAFYWLAGTCSSASMVKPDGLPSLTSSSSAVIR